MKLFNGTAHYLCAVLYYYTIYKSVLVLLYDGEGGGREGEKNDPLTVIAPSAQDAGLWGSAPTGARGRAPQRRASG